MAVTYGNEYMDTKPLTQDTMFQEYEKFRNVYPKFKITKEGLQISGIDIPVEPKSKKKKK